MLRLTHERILLIGDVDRQVQTAMIQAAPGAHVTTAVNYFDALAEMSSHSFTAVLAAAEPIERRPEAAVKALRQLAGDGRVLLFGHPTLEPLSRKMLDFGCDDYIITPANPAEIQQMFGAPPLRMGPPAAADDSDASATTHQPLDATPDAPTRISQLAGLPLADVLLESIVTHPHDAPSAAIKELNAQIAPTMQLHYVPGAPSKPPAVADGLVVLSHAVRCGSDDIANLHLTIPRDEPAHAARHFLAQLAHVIGKVAVLEDRHNRLQKLAITDDLTGVYNARYFRHFLSKIIEKARVMRFPVTLLLFDIDSFKKYNDQYGHCVGDEILKQTASLMKRCVRDHDLVARIGGDEFAVVFWEKEGPRQPREPQPGTPGRPPQTPRQILDRFRRLLSTQEFPGLGAAGRGVLTISGGLAVFPYDASDVHSLIAEADRRLVFGAKHAGKNSIFLVGTNEEGDAD